MTEMITVVSGLPRSGTSLMMKMLDAAGIHPVQDGIREADEDNPKGYFELEKVKKLKEDSSWMPEAKGKAIKVISQLLFDLPAGFDYRIIFMRRNIEEILASQKKMLVRRGTFKEGGPTDAQMREIMLKHVTQVLGWVEKQEGMKLLAVSYNEMFTKPEEHISRISEFLGGLDQDAMAGTIDPALYRNRK